MTPLQPKLYILLIDNWFLYLLLLALQFNFLNLAAWKISALHIIMNSFDALREHFAMSSNVLMHLNARLMCCGESGVIFSCIMPASNHCVFNCSEKSCFALTGVRFLSALTLGANFFRTTSAPFSGLIRTTKIIFVCWPAVKVRNRNPDIETR